MVYAIKVDWMDEFKNNPDKWVNLGRDLIEDACEHKTQDSEETNMRYSGYCDECGFYEDSAEPMMNFAYPLYVQPDEEKVLEVVKRTNLTVLENSESGEYFLVLCGGGMDLSQDIALAYILIGDRIPEELLYEVNKQPKLSVSKEEFKLIAEHIIGWSNQAMLNHSRNVEQWKEALKEVSK